MIRLYRNHLFSGGFDVDIMTLDFKGFPWANWVCFDRDGAMYLVEKPHVADDRTGRSCELAFKRRGKHQLIGIANFDYVEDWKKCLKIVDGKLTSDTFQPKMFVE